MYVFPIENFPLSFTSFNICILRPAYISRTLHFHVASPFATPFEPSRSFYFVRLYRSFPPYIAL